MSKFNAHEVLDQAAETTGWNDHTKLELCLEFLDQNCDHSVQWAFKAFVAGRVAHDEDNSGGSE